MARNRIIRTEFFCDERVGALSHAARLLFVALWVNCDDVGNGRADARILKAQSFAFDDCAVEEVESWLSEIVSQRMIELYEVEGVRFFHLRNFLKHQRIDHPSKSLFPPPRALAEDSPSTQRGLDESSTKRSPKLVKVRSVQGSSGQDEKDGAGAPDPKGVSCDGDLDSVDLDCLGIREEAKVNELLNEITGGKFQPNIAFQDKPCWSFRGLLFSLYRKTEPKTDAQRRAFITTVFDECEQRQIRFPRAWSKVAAEVREEAKAN